MSDNATPPADGVPGANGRLGWRELYLKEDYWAIWVGLALLVVGAAIYLPRPPAGMREEFARLNEILKAEKARAPFPTLAWHEANDAKAKIQAANDPVARKISGWLPKLAKWNDNPLEAFYLDGADAEARAAAVRSKYAAVQAETERLRQAALEAERQAAAADFRDEELNEAAIAASTVYREQLKSDRIAASKTRPKPYNLLPSIVVFGLALAGLLAIGIQVLSGGGFGFLRGFAFVYAVALLAYFFAAQSDVKSFGIGYAAWAIIIGLLVSNTIGTPRWVVPGVQTEYYIKTGLVLLGAEILFGKVLVIGIPGIFVAWVVTPVVLIATYLFGQRILKIPSRSLNMTLSADMSVCGVSAAIATAAACRAKKEELTLAVGISIAFTSIMMFALPSAIRALGMPEVLGGAWIGGTVDATGAVAAAGEFVGERALHVAATIKMIQNVLIGVIAFGVAVYWVTKVEGAGSSVRPSAGEIWRRFPKFVLGFIGASIVFSLIHSGLGGDVGEAMVSGGVIKGWTKTLRGWFFCLAFVSIGLATDFRSLAGYLKGGKPLVLYVCGQALNLVLTLLVAYAMFYLVFPGITAEI